MTTKQKIDHMVEVFTRRLEQKTNYVMRGEDQAYLYSLISSVLALNNLKDYLLDRLEQGLSVAHSGDEPQSAITFNSLIAWVEAQNFEPGVPLNDYQIANLRSMMEGIRLSRTLVQTFDTGDWFHEILEELPVVKYEPAVTPQRYVERYIKSSTAAMAWNKDKMHLAALEYCKKWYSDNQDEQMEKSGALITFINDVIFPNTDKVLSPESDIERDRRLAG